MQVHGEGQAHGDDGGVSVADVLSVAMAVERRHLCRKC